MATTKKLFDFSEGMQGRALDFLGYGVPYMAGEGSCFSHGNRL